jgi:trans-aconitate methyltransferase
MAISRGWDGPSYDRLSEPLERLGREVLDRLELRGDEAVLDAGCGSGRITAALPELPAELRERFVDAVLERLGPRPTIGYVRLNIDATGAAR